MTTGSNSSIPIAIKRGAAFYDMNNLPMLDDEYVKHHEEVMAFHGTDSTRHEAVMAYYGLKMPAIKEGVMKDEHGTEAAVTRKECTTGKMTPTKQPLAEISASTVRETAATNVGRQGNKFFHMNQDMPNSTDAKGGEVNSKESSAYAHTNNDHHPKKAWNLNTTVKPVLFNAPKGISTTTLRTEGPTGPMKVSDNGESVVSCVKKEGAGCEMNDDMESVIDGSMKQQAEWGDAAMSAIHNLYMIMDEELREASDKLAEETPPKWVEKMGLYHHLRCILREH